MNTAAGESTRNGAARRASSSASRVRSSASTERTVVAPMTVTTIPAPNEPPRPIRTRPTKKSKASGGCPAAWVGQLSGWL